MATSEGKTPDALRRQFLQIFHQIARHKHRYDVFRDFVILAATALHNGAVMDEARETEYVTTTGGYAQEDIEGFPKLLAILVELLQPEPRDILGPLYMELEIASREQGQFFTPPELSDLMAAMTFSDQLAVLEEKPFITVSEPACGAGGMILSLVKVMIAQGHNPAERMWVQCVDVNRLAALMCYIQLSLWNVPAEIIVGNSLTLETREVWHTPAHYMGFWTAKLARQNAERGQGGALPAPAEQETPSPVTSKPEPTGDSAPSFDVQLPDRQMDFGF